MAKTESNNEPKNPRKNSWKLNPLTLQILIAFFLALIVGYVLHQGKSNAVNIEIIRYLEIPKILVINALKVLAFPLVFVILVRTFVNDDTANSIGSNLRRLAILLLTNSIVAAIIGFLVVYFLPFVKPEGIPVGKKQDIPDFNILPQSILEPFLTSNVIQIIILAICLGIIARRIKGEQIRKNRKDYLPFLQIIEAFYKAFILIVKWVITLLPLAVFAIVSTTVADKGLATFQSLSGIIFAILAGFFLQGCYYLIRLQFSSKIKPTDFLIKAKDAFLTAFGTSSGIVTSPTTKKVLGDMGIREAFTQLGAYIIVNFNKDATAMSLVMSALYISKITQHELDPRKYLILISLSVVLSMITLSVPNGGMAGVILLFQAVGLDPTDFFTYVLPVEWFLDMFRTVINVMGNMTTVALLEGKTLGSMTDEPN
ncbi:MAG: dicarboxylate/amino acid:cation symporter [Scytonematopsis contorta HA4267-MV1]|jgi:DAACS family dicarboxylate/amino acid:cation (Na+ or H+) symporter|nr:dicarboxylate/amino acid:cation symporter [Scytonematopsis contorta HA4267-MV1]